MRYEFKVNEPVKVLTDTEAPATDGEDVVVPSGTIGVVKKIDRQDDLLPYLVTFQGTYGDAWFAEDELVKSNAAEVEDSEVHTVSELLIELVPTHTANGTGWSLRLWLDGKGEVLVAPHGDFGRVLNNALHELGIQTR